MCLERIIKRIEPGDAESTGVGWKMFNYCPGCSGHSDGTRCESGLIGDYYSDKIRPVGEWIDEEGYRENEFSDKLFPNDGSDPYPAGWHIFAFYPSAVSYRDDFGGELRKVQYRGATTLGEQDGRSVIVAREILIEEGVS